MTTRPSTPRKIWVAFILMALALIVAFLGSWASEGMMGDFKPIAVRLVCLGWGVVLSVAGIVCTVLGARAQPRSWATKIAIVSAGLASAAAAAVATMLTQIFFAE